MPNWVDNSITVHGTPEQMEKFTAWLNEPMVLEYEWVNFPNEDGTPNNEKRTKKIDGFSFHKVVPVPKEIYGEYWTTSGTAKGVRYGETNNNWYNWNVANWGTKWDAREGEIGEPFTVGEHTSLTITFQTAWSPPEPAFAALSTMYPELTFSMSYTDESGWFGEGYAKDGEFYEELYVEPASHADYSDNGRECQACMWENEEFLYTDCPRVKEEVTV
jgi:hypothetical protein